MHTLEKILLKIFPEMPPQPPIVYWTIGIRLVLIVVLFFVARITDLRARISDFSKGK